MDSGSMESQKVSRTELTYEDFVTLHSQQLTQSDVPSKYWRTLFTKIKHEVFDAGQYFQLQCQQIVDEEEEEAEPELMWSVVVTAENGIDMEDPKHIYLIDHAWTYRTEEARDHLTNIPGLAERMAAIMGVKVEGCEKQDIIEGVLKEMWRFNQFYRIQGYKLGTKGSKPNWYVMDEFGSRIQHSESPNVKMAPFMFSVTQMSYTIMWPVQKLEKEEEVTRDYLHGITDPVKREAKMMIWMDLDFTGYSFQQKEPSADFFQVNRMSETMPEPVVAASMPTDRKIRAFIDYPGIPRLTDPRYEITEDATEADIVFVTKHYKDYRELSVERPHVMISQFPNESTLTCKDLMSIHCARSGFGKIDPETLESIPDWLALTYNLQMELQEFVSYYQHREKKELENIWILKPWNQNNSSEICISDNLAEILSIAQTGPMIASRYVTDIVTLYRDDISASVKFDIRYECLLRSVKPLKVFVHRVFVVRFANRTYNLENLDDVQKHLTMLKSFENVPVYEIPRAEFVPRFESQYPDFQWEEVEKSIFEMLHKVFKACAEKDPPVGICHYDNSRALYGADVILKWAKNDKGERVMKPVICEMNYYPNIKMFRKFYPELTNDVFNTLFLDDIESRPLTLLNS